MGLVGPETTTSNHIKRVESDIKSFIYKLKNLGFSPRREPLPQLCPAMLAHILHKSWSTAPRYINIIV